METPSNIVAIIPARGGSKSIPRKNVIPFCGKPLIAWSIEQALECKYISDVYVTTDDREIAEVSQRYGAQIIRRPADLATDTASSESALLHAITEIERHKKIDTVVFLQATSPLRDADDITAAVELFTSNKADSLFSAATLDDFCLWGRVGGNLHSITFDYKNRGRRQDRDPYYLENGSIYIFRVESIRQHENRLGGKMAVYPMDLWKSYEIDNPEDLELCAFFMRNKIHKQCETTSLLKDINLIVYDFDGVFTDNKVLLREDGLESVVVNRSDGLAIGMIKERGIRQIILSKEKNKVVEARANKLKIPVIQGVDDKRGILLNYCRDNNIDPGSVVYIGNDLNDVEVMKCVGHPVCPSDAYEEVKEISNIILRVPGGAGVVRDFLRYVEPNNK